MKNNKVYLPTDAIARHEDFDVWYADGETFLSIKGAWSKELSLIHIWPPPLRRVGRVEADGAPLQPVHHLLRRRLAKGLSLIHI